MIVAFDPGANGAIAFLSPDGTLEGVVDMPSVRVGTRTQVAAQGLALLLAARRPVHAYVEQVAARPGQGVTSMFSFGRSLGVLDGVLAALGVPVTYVTPAKWKAGMQVTADKGSSRRRAMQLFPAWADQFQRVRDDGRAEAALLGAYALSSPASPCISAVEPAKASSGRGIAGVGAEAAQRASVWRETVCQDQGCTTLSGHLAGGGE